MSSKGQFQTSQRRRVLRKHGYTNRSSSGEELVDVEEDEEEMMISLTLKSL